MQAHCDSCEPCRKEAEAYRAAASLVTEYRIADIPASQTTWQDLQAQIAREKAVSTLVPVVVPARRRRGTTRLAFAWSTTALAGLTLFLWSRPEPTPAPAVENSLGGGLSVTKDANQAEVVSPLRADRSLTPAFAATAWQASEYPAVQVVSFARRTEKRAESFFARLRPRRRFARMWRRIVEPTKDVSPQTASSTGVQTRSQPSALPAAFAALSPSLIDGAVDTGWQTPRNFVMAPVSAAAPDAPTRRYVMDSINLDSQRNVSASVSPDAQENQQWQ